MFDITLFPLTSLFIALAYPIFIRYIFIPIVVFAKLQNLVLLSLYYRSSDVRDAPFSSTNVAIFDSMCFLLWIRSVFRFLFRKRTIGNFFPRVLTFALDGEIAKYFNKGCGLGRESWPPYGPRKSTFHIIF